MPALEGLVVEAVEWLPSGSDAGLARVRGRWSAQSRGEPGLPSLGVRRGEEQRSVESLPDARFGRDPLVWRGAKWFLRRKYGAAMTPKPMLAGGLVALLLGAAFLATRRNGD